MKKEFKKLLKKNFSREHELYLAIKYKLKSLIQSPKEIPKKMGDKNSDKIFYVISINDDVRGLFCLYLDVLEGIHYAIEKNWIPVIRSGKDNQYYDKIKGEDVWEYYFEQPFNISMQEVMQSKKVIEACAFHFIPGLTIWLDCPYSIRKFLKDINIRNICYKIADKYLRLNTDVLSYVQSKYEEIIKENSKPILGVICRGTDYVNAKPNGHFIQPKPTDIIDKINDKELWGCDRIFLATEDQKVYEVFKEKFGENLLHSQEIHFGNTGNKWLAEVEISESRYELGLQYLTSIYLLSRCNALVGGLAAGTVGALIMNGGKYEHTYFWDLGVYGTDD